MSSKKCTACKKKFHPCPKVPRQSYCSSAECQSERQRLWQREKRATDPSYKQNESDSQKNWSSRNPGYWRKYRLEHPKYCARNRVLERERKRRAKTAVAKMDASASDSLVPSGTYQLIPVNAPGVANEDVLTVEIKFLSSTSTPESEVRRPRVTVANESVMGAV